jgi:hypothetical protein
MTIILPYGGRKQLAKELKVSIAFISACLNDRKGGPKSNLVRKMAIERGGHVFDPNRARRAE